ncbi:MAG: hypothetical protein IIZ39_12415 [Blautia sp.]|nr:hypothetical protein [Blautia sp.]
MAGSEEENSLPALSSFEGHFIPKGTTVVLLCTLAGAYNYPFKKVRIFNCNLEQAFRMR